MPFNGSGTFSVYTPGNPVVTGTTISSTVANATNSDFATGLSNCVAKDGQSTPTANLPMGGFKLTGLAVGSSAADSIRFDQAMLVTGTNMTGGINDAKTTVASATTPTIFAITVGNTIDYTGTVACTGFASAPQAGATRRLVCAGAAPFTAGANLLIQGVASGSTYTAQAGEVLTVIAITTTQFRIVGQFPFNSSSSSTFTFNGTGSTSGSIAMTWQVQGNFVTIRIPALTVTSGTGSTALISNTGLPTAIRPAATQSAAAMNIINSGAGVAGPGLFQIDTSGIITLFRDGAATAFTNSTSCGLSSAQTITYSLT